MNNKTLGYSLIFIGLFIIMFSGVNVYIVFTGQKLPFNLFSFDPITLDLRKFVPEAPPNTDLQQNLVQADLLNEPANLLAFFMLMSFIATSGFKIASLGVMLVRTIKVQLKEEK